MSKPMRIPMTYRPTGETLTWTVTRERVWAHDGKYDAWLFTDHDGYTRFGGKTWAELRDRFCDRADGYDMAHRLS